MIRLFGAPSLVRPEGLLIEAGDLRLRVPEAADFPAWSAVRAASRAFLEPWEPLWPADDLTERAFRRRVARYREEIAADSAYPFFLFHRASGALLGGLTLSNVRRRAAMSASLGYWMGAMHAGQGHMSRAVPALCRHAFAMLALERIEAACLPENAASIRVLEKAGFRREGFARGYLAIAGTRRDHLTFALLRSDPGPE
ncbi:GNAT family N-acetyltransferase [Rhabdaerophilum calidifontis]|uniref:GNAT family N-acetyltransferase n=1 Tax=Rhabdaerophilum calidifontis TaxID=2604328 RepID=UPI003923332B